MDVEATAGRVDRAAGVDDAEPLAAFWRIIRLSGPFVTDDSGFEGSFGVSGVA